MDAVGLIYYALVCGGIAVFAPNVPNRLARAVVGLGAGAISAFVFPFIRALFGN